MVVSQAKSCIQPIRLDYFEFRGKFESRIMISEITKARKWGFRMQILWVPA